MIANAISVITFGLATVILIASFSVELKQPQATMSIIGFYIISALFLIAAELNGIKNKEAE
jgi:hypothetical protein